MYNLLYTWIGIVYYNSYNAITANIAIITTIAIIALEFSRHPGADLESTGCAA